MLVVVGAILALAAVPLAMRELGAYRTRDRSEQAAFGAIKNATSDLFIYSRRRLVRRLTGIAVLSALGVVLVVWELAPPSSPSGATVLLGLLLTGVVALVLIAILDLRETSTTAKVGKG